MVLKRISVVALCVLLCVSLLGANVALSLDRGALDAAYVKQAAAEEGLYEQVRSEAIDAVGQEVPASNELPVDVQGVVADALSVEYVRNQSEANIDRVYAFLHGGDDLEIVLDTRPLKNDTIDTIVAEVENASVADLVGETDGASRLANLTESEASYEAERQRIREQIKEQVVTEAGLDPEDDFGSQVLANLSASETSYQTERQAFREQLKEELKRTADVRPEDDFGSQVLANLSASETSYEAERRAFEEARKQEIQEETDRHMTEPELEMAYQNSLDEIRAELRSGLEAEYLTEDTPEPLHEPIGALVNVTVDALTTDMTYGEFTTEYEQVKADVDAALDVVVENNMDEVRGELRTEIRQQVPMPEDAPAELETARGDLIDLVVDALTTDMTYDEFSTEYDAVKADIDAGLDAAIDQRLSEYRDEVREEMASQVQDASVPEPLRDDVDDAVDLAVDAMLTDMSYDEFETEWGSIKTQMAENAADYYLNEHDGGVPDRIVVSDDVDQSELEPVQRAVSLIGLLSWLLPVLSLGMIGGVYGVTRREDTVALAVGIVVLVVGGLSAAAARILPAEAVGFVELDVSDGIVESIQGIVQALFDPLWTQSLVLLGVGAALVAVGIALRFELGPFGRSAD